MRPSEQRGHASPGLGASAVLSWPTTWLAVAYFIKPRPGAFLVCSRERQVDSLQAWLAASFAFPVPAALYLRLATVEHIAFGRTCDACETQRMKEPAYVTCDSR